MLLRVLRHQPHTTALRTEWHRHLSEAGNWGRTGRSVPGSVCLGPCTGTISLTPAAQALLRSSAPPVHHSHHSHRWPALCSTQELHGPGVSIRQAAPRSHVYIPAARKLPTQCPARLTSWGSPQQKGTPVPSSQNDLCPLQHLPPPSDCE